MKDEKVFKFLQKCNRNHGVKGLHGFQAKIKNGYVWVECRGHEIYIESRIYNSSGEEARTEFVGTTIAAANRLEMLGVDIDTSIEM